jgi:hypothetical protein
MPGASAGVPLASAVTAMVPPPVLTHQETTPTGSPALGRAILLRLLEFDPALEDSPDLDSAA